MAQRESQLLLFVIESPNPIDVLRRRTEGKVIASVSELVGHASEYFMVKTEDELRAVARYIASIDTSDKGNERESKKPLCVHISAHGNGDGIGLVTGERTDREVDLLSWSDLLSCLRPVFDKNVSHAGERILVLSSCAADEQTLTRAISATKDLINPPQYVFTTMGSPNWQDAAVQWALFYHKLPEFGMADKESVKKLLHLISSAELGGITYFRLEGRRYHRYPRRNTH